MSDSPTRAKSCGLKQALTSFEFLLTVKQHLQRLLNITLHTSINLLSHQIYFKLLFSKGCKIPLMCSQAIAMYIAIALFLNHTLHKTRLDPILESIY
jgi:hypothetical protein